MRRIAISVAAFAAMGLLVSSAQADNLQGAPEKSANQCFKWAQPNDARDSRWGSWGPCPQTASAAVAPAPKARKRSVSR
jgi:hypothetical protein